MPATSVHITPGGRYLGRKPPTPDPRDRPYRLLERHLEGSYPPAADLSPKLPPCWDQGQLGSCGPNTAMRICAALWPGEAPPGSCYIGSRLQLYWNTRLWEGDGPTDDSGVETRDLFKVLMSYGTLPETLWPYDLTKWTDPLPWHLVHIAEQKKVASYTRIVTEDDYYHCLGVEGMPIAQGFDVVDSFENEQTDKTGIFIPSGKPIGGHDVTVVGYDTNFKQNPVFKASGLNPADQAVSDKMLKIANSWSANWGDHGHFWVPVSFMLEQKDAWTARL